MHTGSDDRCNQELLPEVSAPQSDLSHAPKPLAGSTPSPAGSSSGSESHLTEVDSEISPSILCSQRP